MDGRLFLRDEELDKGVASMLGAGRHLLAASEAARRAAQLNDSELALLLAMHANPGQLVSALRTELFMTVPTFARLLARLDGRNFVRKEKSRDDGRSRKLFLSDTGEAVLAPCLEALREHLRGAYANVGAENVAGARKTLSTVAGNAHG